MPSSADSESQLPAAASSDPDPGPVYIRVELISGGKKAKSIVSGGLSSGCRRAWHDGEPGAVARDDAAGARDRPARQPGHAGHHGSGTGQLAGLFEGGYA